MRKNFGAKPYIYPQPVLIIAAYDEDGTPNAMNAAWGGVAGGNKVSLCISPGHKTVKNILAKGAFTVSMADEDHVVEADYVGIVSGNEVPDKLEKAGFHTTKSDTVDAPVIDELPLTLECRLDHYDAEAHMMIGEIVNVSADEKIIGENGTIDPEKLKPITFDQVNNTYIALGRKVGDAFKDGAQLKGVK